ncbi:hypothetical protein [Cupriavidus sp. DL-D2]|uniref:hypothetical protein n=1 Tax=Cupriavidus sp. DL-D2 TaxID=3144974 RepID=UPI003212CC7F
MIGTGHTFTLDAPFNGPHGAVLDGFLRVGFIHDEDANEIEVTETILQVGPHRFPYNGDERLIRAECWAKLIVETMECSQ